MLKIDSLEARISPRFRLPKRQLSGFVRSLELLHKTKSTLFTPSETEHACREYSFSTKRRGGGNGNTGEFYNVYDTTARVDYTPSVPLTFELLEGELNGLEFITDLRFGSQNNVRVTPSAFEGFKNRWTAYTRRDIAVDKKCPDGEYAINVAIIGRIDDEQERRFNDLAEKFQGQVSIRRDLTPLIQISVQNGSRLNAESEKLVRSLYNEVLRFGIDNMPDAITDSKSCLRRLGDLVEEGRGIEAHDPQFKFRLLYIPPAIAIYSRQHSEGRYPKVFGSGQLKKTLMCADTMYLTYESRVIDTIFFSDLLRDPNIVIS